MPSGTVLFSSRAPIGYVAIAANPVATNQGFKSFVLASGIDPSYVYYYLQRARDMAVALASGTTFLEISGAKATQIPFALAPLPEQHRIVEEIEKQLTRLDAAVAALERARANLKRYRASVLRAACEGRLVPTEAELARAEGREYEPAAQLLERILKERRAAWEADELAKMLANGKVPKDEGWKAKYQEPAAPDKTNLAELPGGWVWSTAEQLSDATRAITYGVVKLGDPVADGIPTLRSSNVRHLSLELEEVKRIAPRIANQYRRTFLRGGEILVTVRGTLGGVAVVPALLSGCNISREVAMLALADDSLGQVAALLIGSPPIQTWLLSHTKGITYTGINIETLKETPIPIPPRAEQERIVAEAERRLSVIDGLETVVQHSLRRADRLRQSILKRAFEGKLVPQDPNDEPASVLLERIRAERSSAGQAQESRRQGKRRRGER